MHGDRSTGASPLGSQSKHLANLHRSTSTSTGSDSKLTSLRLRRLGRTMFQEKCLKNKTNIYIYIIIYIYMCVCVQYIRFIALRPWFHYFWMFLVCQSPSELFSASPWLLKLGGRVGFSIQGISSDQALQVLGHGGLARLDQRDLRRCNWCML